MPSTYLTPQAYDLAEQSARRKAPNRIIEAFRPAQFDLVGYPTRIETLEELERYIDPMYEGQPRGLLERMLGGLTPEELSVAKTVARVGSDLVWNITGRRLVPRPSLLPAILGFRQVRSMFPDTSSVILEIGPGSGYLGAMLISAGYAYISTDVTQAFYIFQSNLFAGAARDTFSELASADDDLKSVGRIVPGHVVHVPRWKFATSNPGTINLDIDCVIGSGVFSEMHPNAFGYLVNQARRWLSVSKNGQKVFYIHGPGAEGSNTLNGVLNKLQQSGFELARSDKLGASDSDLKIDIGYFFIPRDGAAQSAEKSPRAIELNDLIVNGRTRDQSSSPASFELLNEYLLELGQYGGLRTEDEKFMRFCSTGAIDHA